MFWPGLLVLLASPVDLNAGVSTEVRGGVMPVSANQASEPFAGELMTPIVEAELKDRTIDLRLAYFPRFLWQQQEDNPLGHTFRPLFLNQASLLLSARPTERTSIAGRATGSYGEPDYSILSSLLGPGQATSQPGMQTAVPVVQKILTIAGGLTVTGDLTHRLRLIVGADGSHFQPIIEQPPRATGPAESVSGVGHFTGVPPTPAITTPLVEQSSVSGRVGLSYRLTSTDELSLNVGASYIDFAASGFEPARELTLASSMLSLRSRFTATNEIRVGIGLAETRDNLGLQVLSPAANADLMIHNGSVDAYGFWLTLRGAVEEFVDPVLKDAYPRAITSAQLALVFPPNWSASLQADFTTSIRLTTPTPPPGGTLPDETGFYISLPVRYRVSANVVAEVGGRWTDRAPALASGDPFHQKQLWAYMALTVSTRALPEWGSR
jgi:hypothetical protein